MEFIRENKTPFITGTGEQKRDMLHVSDAVMANIFAMTYEKNFSGNVFDVGTGDNISLNEIRNIVKKYFSNVNFEYVEERSGDIMETRADTRPLLEMGWKSEISIKAGINKCFRQLKEKLEC